MTAKEARDKSYVYANGADGEIRSGEWMTGYALLAIFWQHEADRLKIEEQALVNYSRPL